MSKYNLHLRITVNQNKTVLPRCLQILSRRGFVLKALLTYEISPAIAQLHCAVQGPERWHEVLPQLLSKAVDVLAVERIEVDD